jgi:hypothetical protein
MNHFKTDQHLKYVTMYFLQKQEERKQIHTNSKCCVTDRNLMFQNYFQYELFINFITDWTNKLHGFSLQANYTNWVTAACRRS